MIAQGQLDAAIDVLHQTTPADPELPVLVAGDPEAAIRAQRLRDGILLPDSLLQKLREVCRGCNAEYLLEG